MIRSKASSHFLKLSSFVVLGIFGFQTGYADDVLPVFSGNWYSAISGGYRGADGVYYYTYSQPLAAKLVENYFNSQLATNVQSFYRTYSYNKYIVLQNISMEYEPTNTLPIGPQDFPGSWMDYSQVIAQGGPTPTDFKDTISGQICYNPPNYPSNCAPIPALTLQPSGNSILFLYTNDSFRAFPHYVCPVGSRLSLFTGRCSNTPLVANADVVGRDLDAPIIGGVTGHIGLTTYSDLTGSNRLGNYVLQVMNEPGNVVQQVTLGNFEHATFYWGEVYGLPGIDPKSEADDARITLEAGWNQRNYNPTYTPGFTYQEGGLSNLTMIDDQTGLPIQQLGITQAIFRCDTFVDFAYSKGYKVNLPLQPPPVIGPPPVLIPTPVTTYGSFLNKRTDVPLQTADSTLSSAPTLSAAQRDALGMTPNLSDSEAAELEKTVKAVLNNNALSTAAKNNNLWSMAQENQTDTAKFSYFVDTLALGQRACILVSQYSQAYSEQTSIANKKELISAIANSCLKSSALTATHLSSAEISSTLQAHTFITQTLESEKNPVLIKQALSGASEILPANAENYALISQAINRLKQADTNLTDEDLRSLSLIQIAFVFASPDLQHSALAALLEANKPDPEANAFNQSLLLVLKTLDPKAISDSEKPALLNYLQAQKSEHPNMDSFQTQEGVDFLMAQASLKNKDEASKNQYIIGVVLNASPKDQALLIGQLDSSVLANIPLDALKKLQEGLQKQMISSGQLSAINQANKKEETPSEREMQGVAISRLYKMIHEG